MAVVKSENWGGDRRSEMAKAKHINHPGNRLWEYRVSRGLTQRELAERLYVTQQCISCMERGATRISAYTQQWLDAQEKGEAI